MYICIWLIDNSYCQCNVHWGLTIRYLIDLIWHKALGTERIEKETLVFHLNPLLPTLEQGILQIYPNDLFPAKPPRSIQVLNELLVFDWNHVQSSYFVARHIACLDQPFLRMMLVMVDVEKKSEQDWKLMQFVLEVANFPGFEFLFCCISKVKIFNECSLLNKLTIKSENWFESLYFDCYLHFPFSALHLLNINN